MAVDNYTYGNIGRYYMDTKKSPYHSISCGLGTILLSLLVKFVASLLVLVTFWSFRFDTTSEMMLRVASIVNIVFLLIVSYLCVVSF
jgi:phosphoglycerol transferase MdoB-like AlkP superfamily enzyme